MRSTERQPRIAALLKLPSHCKTCDDIVVIGGLIIVVVTARYSKNAIRFFVITRFGTAAVAAALRFAVATTGLDSGVMTRVMESRGCGCCFVAKTSWRIPMSGLRLGSSLFPR